MTIGICKNANTMTVIQNCRRFLKLLCKAIAGNIRDAPAAEIENAQPYP